MKPALSHDEAIQVVRKLALLPCVPVDSELVERGAEISRRHRISYWDGAILAAAERLGAQTVFSEDLSHGQRYGKIQVINPFKTG